MNRLELAACLLYPELQHLIDLRQGSWVFQPVLVDGTLMLLTGWRAWVGGWTDAIAIRGQGDAKAYRCDADGGEVWGREGTLDHVIAELFALPPPGEPGAPRLVKGPRHQLWWPGMGRP
jgi:hypothetical protein